MVVVLFPSFLLLPYCSYYYSTSYSYLLDWLLASSSFVVVFDLLLL